MLYDVLYLFLLFIIYSFIGWVIESIVVSCCSKRFVNRGFLIGPYCPIYGFGALIMLFIFTEYKNDPVNFFVMCAVYASVLEYFTSYLMETVFNARWWDYSEVPFNFNGRICLKNSIVFGILGILLGYYLNPLIIKLLNLLSTNVLYAISIIIIVVFIADLFTTFHILSKLQANIKSLNIDVTEDLHKQIIKILEKNHIFRSFPLLKQKINKIINKKE